MKRVFCFLLALCLALGCASALAADYPADKASYKVYIRLRNSSGDPDEMLLFKEMEDITNVHLDFVKVPEAEWNEKLNLLLGAGVDLPDAIYSAYAMTIDDLVNYGSQGILIPLNDYIEQYMPNLTRMLTEHPEIRAAITAPDGNIYGLPYVMQDGVTGQIPSNMFINKAWLDKLGLEIPRTIDELEAALTAFKEQDPNGNGKADEIPMTFQFLSSQRDLGGLFGMFGYADRIYSGQHHFVVDDGKVVFVPATEGYKEACAYLYEHFFSKGLIDIEGFTMDKATYKAQNQGEDANIGVFFGWNIYDLGAVHVDEYVPFAPVLGPNGTTSWGQVTTSGLEPKGLVITSACKDPKYLLMWADLLYDDLYAMQMAYGPIGVNLVDNGDGTYSFADIPEGQTYDEFKFGNTFPDSCLAILRDFFDKTLPLPDNAVAKDKVNTELYLPVATTLYYPGLMFSEEDNDRISLIGNDIIAYAEEMRAKWLAHGGVDAEWNAYIQRLNAMGLDEYTEIYQHTYDNAYAK